MFSCLGQRNGALDTSLRIKNPPTKVITKAATAAARAPNAVSVLRFTAPSPNQRLANERTAASAGKAEKPLPIVGTRCAAARRSLGAEPPKIEYLAHGRQ